MSNIYRKKPVEVEAMKFTYPPSDELLAWIGRDAVSVTKDRHPDAKAEMEIRTLEDGVDGRARHVATEGDMIIRGIQGEFYTCKPDIFDATYDRVSVAEEANSYDEWFHTKVKDALEDNAWKEYAADFNALTDEEVEREVKIEEVKLAEAENWLEAVASWKAAGKPRDEGDTAPDKIWVDTVSVYEKAPNWPLKPVWAATEYTRTDLVEALEAENKIFRGALADIHEGEPEWPNSPQKELDWCRNRARAALKEGV